MAKGSEPLALLVLALMPVALAFNVCPLNNTVTLRASAPDNLFKDRTQYVLVSPLDQGNISYALQVLGCASNWTSKLPVRNDSVYFVDHQGREWYEVSYHVAQADLLRMLMVTITFGPENYTIDGKDVANCPVINNVTLSFTNASLVGQFCTVPSSEPTSGLSIFGYVMVAVVLMLVLVVLERIFFFNCNAKDEMTEGLDNPAFATPSTSDKAGSEGSVVPQGPETPTEDVKGGGGWMSPFRRFVPTRNSLVPLIQEA